MLHPGRDDTDCRRRGRNHDRLGPRHAQEILTFKIPEGGVRALDITPDGKLVAVSARDGVYLWRWAAGEEPIKLALKKKDGWGMGVRFSPDGKLLAVGDRHEIGVFLWDLQAGKVVGALGDEEQQFYVDSMAFTPDGKILATPPGRRDIATPPARQDKSVLLWDTASGKVVRRLNAAPLEPSTIAISRDGRWLAATDFMARRKKVLGSGLWRGVRRRIRRT